MERINYIKTGINLCKEIVKLVPIEPYTKHYEGRKNAEKIEKNWKKRLTKSFRYKGNEVKIINPERDDRNWIDLIFIYDGLFFPVNFKAGIGKTEDNISGLKYIGYLLFYGVNKDYTIKGISSHKHLAKRIIDIKKGKEKMDLTNRDYFCIAYNLGNGSIRVVPISCILDKDLRTNPSNVFQTNFHTAKFDLNRTQEESINFIIKKYIEYAKKKADAYSLFKEAGLGNG